MYFRGHMHGVNNFNEYAYVIPCFATCALNHLCGLNIWLNKNLGQTKIFVTVIQL